MLLASIELVNNAVDWVTVIIRMAEATRASTWLKPWALGWGLVVDGFKG